MSIEKLIQENTAALIALTEAIKSAKPAPEPAPAPAPAPTPSAITHSQASEIALELAKKRADLIPVILDLVKEAAGRKTQATIPDIPEKGLADFVQKLQNLEESQEVK